MIGWLLLACVVGVAALPVFRRVYVFAGGLVEWEGSGRKITIGSPTSIAIISTTALGIGLFGAGGVAISSLGGGAPASPASTPVGAPNTPTIDAVVFAATGDSARVVLGTFVGSGSDTHDSTQIEADTTGGDFASPQYHQVSLGAVLTDTVLADSGAVIDIRARVKGADGGWSAWDTLSGVDMVPGSMLLAWADWTGATGSNDHTSNSQLTGNTGNSFSCDSIGEVVSADGADPTGASLGFPAAMQNVWRYQYTDSALKGGTFQGTCMVEMDLGADDTLRVDLDTLYMRWFEYRAIPNGEPSDPDNSTAHSLHVGCRTPNTGDYTYWQRTPGTAASDSISAELLLFNTTNRWWEPGPSGNVPTHELLRFEVAFIRQAVDSVHPKPYIYLGNGTTPWRDPSDYLFTDNNNLTMSDVVPLRVDDATCINHFQFGNNDPDRTFSQDTVSYVYLGGLAWRINGGLIGPYPATSQEGN